MHDLVVMSPFGDYRSAQRITDAGAIAAIRKDPHKLAMCRQVFSDSAPAPAPAPAPAAKAAEPAPAPVEAEKAADVKTPETKAEPAKA